MRIYVDEFDCLVHSIDDCLFRMETGDLFWVLDEEYYHPHIVTPTIPQSILIFHAAKGKKGSVGYGDRLIDEYSEEI